MNRFRSLIASLSVAAAAFPASAMLIYDETASGDLSSNPLLPTPLSLDLGSNFIDGSVDSRDRDYFTLTLPPGTHLAAIVLLASSGSEATFLSFQSGATFTEPAGGADLRNLLGYASFFHSDIGTDLLQSLGSASDAIGFNGSPTGEIFTFWIDQASPTAANYKFEFLVASDIPTPGTFAILATAIVIALPRNRRSTEKAAS
ncbi:MAG: hypothetical protein KF805_02870 [Phycisphaeraceae bacterium]|nr:hypothetical protein [Phycisphaeraceae bacterium]